MLTLPGSNGNEATYATPMLLAFEAGVLLLGVALIAAPKLGAPSHHHGAALGTAAGFLFGLSDVAIKALTHVEGGPLAMLASPWLVLRRSAARSPSSRRRAASRPATPARGSGPGWCFWRRAGRNGFCAWDLLPSPRVFAAGAG